MEKHAGFKLVPSESKRQSDVIQRTENAWKVNHWERSRPSREAFLKILIPVLPPVWFCRYSCIFPRLCLSFSFSFLPSFLFSKSPDFVVFIPLRCNVLLCRLEACTLSDKNKKEFYLFVLILFRFCCLITQLSWILPLKRWNRWASECSFCPRRSQKVEHWSDDMLHQWRLEAHLTCNSCSS